MTLLDRARARRDELAKRRGNDRTARDRSERRSLVPVIRRILDLEENRITADDLRVVRADRFGSPRQLYCFTLEGLHFVVGTYWSDGGDKTLLAVQTELVRDRLEWPPPRPESVHNTRWAPTGYVAVYALHQLADAFDGDLA